jgi:hypothetical protein
MRKLPNELISIILQKIRIPVLGIIAEKNRKIRDIAVYDKIAIKYNIETECLIKFLEDHSDTSDPGVDDAYMLSLFMDTKLIQGKEYITEILKARKMRRALCVLDTESYYSDANILGTCKNIKDFTENFNRFRDRNTLEKNISVLQKTLYILIEENNRDIFSILTKGHFYEPNLIFRPIKSDLFIYALSRETDGEIVLDLGYLLTKQELLKAVEMAIDSGSDCPGMNSNINSKGENGWSNIPGQNMRYFVLMLIQKEVFSIKIYKILLEKVIRNHDYDLMRIVLNEYRTQIPG